MFKINKLKEALGYKEESYGGGCYTEIRLQTLRDLEETLHSRINRLEREHKAFIQNLYKDKYVYTLSEDDCISSDDIDRAVSILSEIEYAPTYHFGQSISVEDLQQLGKYETLKANDRTYIISKKDINK